MKKSISLLLTLGFVFFLCGSGKLLAQDTADLNISVTLLAWYDLNLGETAITFSDMEPTPGNPPDNVSIEANEGAVSVRVFAVQSPSIGLQLTVLANGDLSGTETIDIDAISWTTTGDGYQDGTMSSTTAVTAGSWGSGSILHWHEGTFTYFFERDYQTQPPGTYTATVTYTLSSV